MWLRALALDTSPHLTVGLCGASVISLLAGGRCYCFGSRVVTIRVIGRLDISETFWKKPKILKQTKHQSVWLAERQLHISPTMTCSLLRILEPCIIYFDRHRKKRAESEYVTSSVSAYTGCLVRCEFIETVLHSFSALCG